MKLKTSVLCSRAFTAYIALNVQLDSHRDGGAGWQPRIGMASGTAVACIARPSTSRSWCAVAWCGRRLPTRARARDGAALAMVLPSWSAARIEEVTELQYDAFLAAAVSTQLLSQSAADRFTDELSGLSGRIEEVTEAPTVVEPVPEPAAA